MGCIRRRMGRPTGERAAALLLLLLAVAAPPARAAEVVLHAPRAFGYFIGDTFTHDAVVTLDPGFVLDPASLPRPRAVTYWLDLAGVDLKERPAADGARRYRLALTYQTFYAPLEPRALDVPAVTLIARDGETRRTLKVPAWTFVASPLREIVTSRAAGAMALQPDAEPRPYGLGTERRLAAGAAGLGVLSLAALAALRGWGPFARRRRPFGAAAGTMARTLAATPGADGYRAALLALHRAFDTAAGRRLLADDAGDFLARRPALFPLKEGVGRFFAASRLVFFGGRAEVAMDSLPPAELLAIARRLAAAERAAP